MSAPAMPRRSPGRPLDPSLSGRFIDAGMELIADRGLHRLNTEVLADRVRAGKAGFYRRWPDVDHFLADVARAIADDPVTYPEPRTARTDLTALVMHQVAGRRGLVATELLGRLPRSPRLHAAWVADDGVAGQLFLATEAIAAASGIPGMPSWFARLHRGVVALVAFERQQRLVGLQEPAWAVVQRRVDELLGEIARVAA